MIIIWANIEMDDWEVFSFIQFSLTLVIKYVFISGEPWPWALWHDFTEGLSDIKQLNKTINYGMQSVTSHGGFSK